MWELGLNRHPVDRALTLASWARPDLPAHKLPELPLGSLNADLLRLREAWFGPEVRAVANCAGCGSLSELSLNTRELLSICPEGDERQRLEAGGMVFRVPNSRDLAAVASEPDPERAVLTLLARCLVGDVCGDLGALAGEVEAGLEELDPAADFEIELCCEACGASWADSLEVAGLLWDEVDARVRLLLGQIHVLAASYGWTESEILSLTPRRRALYAEMTGG
ncbi:MAG: hypothetical protein ACRDKW_11860 [Actinomycetota bacterium]